MASILMISEDFPPNVVGGVGSHVYDLASGLVKHGWSVTVLADGPEAIPQITVNEGVRVCRMQLFSKSNREEVFRTSAVVEQCKQLARLAGFDILHLHDSLYVSAKKTLRAQFGARAIFTQHVLYRQIRDRLERRAPAIERSLPRLAQQVSTEQEVMRCADAILCVSDYVKRIVEQTYDVHPPLWTVPLGVDAGRFSQVNEEEVRRLRDSLAAPDERISLFVGRANQIKGIPELLTAISLVAHQAARAVKFILILSDVGRRELENLGQTLDFNGRALFFGNIKRELIPFYFSAADFVVMPSRYEYFGLVALEAMAAGKPVIVSDVDPLNRLISHGVTGRVVPLLKRSKRIVDSEALAAAILELAEMPYGRLRQMGEQGSLIARQQYTKELMVERTIAIYEKYMTGECVAVGM